MALDAASELSGVSRLSLPVSGHSHHRCGDGDFEKRCSGGDAEKNEGFPLHGKRFCFRVCSLMFEVAFLISVWVDDASPSANSLCIGFRSH